MGTWPSGGRRSDGLKFSGGLEVSDSSRGLEVGGPEIYAQYSIFNAKWMGMRAYFLPKAEGNNFSGGLEVRAHIFSEVGGPKK